MEAVEVNITKATYISSRAVALRRDSLSSSVLFPPILRLRASPTSAQSIPRSAQSCSLADFPGLRLSLRHLVHGGGELTRVVVGRLVTTQKRPGPVPCLALPPDIDQTDGTVTPLVAWSCLQRSKGKVVARDMVPGQGRADDSEH